MDTHRSYGKVNSVAFSPDGKTLASGSADKTVRFWDAVTGEHKWTATKHTEGVTSIAFSPEGRCPCQWVLGWVSVRVEVTD